jgi:hypothetical protein
MKKLYIILYITFLFTFLAKAQTTAVDFTLNDCDGVSQSLYKTLDSGKVVILFYEHQCSSCVQGANLVKSVYNSKYSNNPDVKIIYLDNGGFSCSSINNWVASNNFIQGPKIAYKSDYSSPYGSGMPVIAICGPYLHKVYFTAISVAQASDTAKMRKAIDTALAQIPLSIQEAKKTTNSVNVYPNPVSGNYIYINFSSRVNQKISIDVMDLTGKTVYSSYDIQMREGDNNIKISDAEMKNGVYFCRIKAADGNYVRKLIINK